MASLEERVADRVHREGLPTPEVVFWYWTGSGPHPRVGDAITLPDGRSGRVLTSKPSDDLNARKLTVRTWREETKR